MTRNAPIVTIVNRLLKENGLRQLILEPTRLTNRGGSCIDWIIINSEYVNNSGVMDELLSDHFPVFVVRKKSREIVKKIKKQVIIFKNFNEDIFKALYAEIDWNIFFANKNPDEILEIMFPYKIFVFEKIKPHGSLMRSMIVYVKGYITSNYFVKLVTLIFCYFEIFQK